MKNKYQNFLLVLLAGLVLVASGCADTSAPEDNVENEDEAQAPGEASSENLSEDSGESSGSAEISLTSLNIPEEVTLDQNFMVEATFENTGEKSGEFETTVVTFDEGSDISSFTGHKIQGEVAAGENESFETSMKASDVTWNQIGLRGGELRNADSNVSVVPRKMRIGESYTIPNQIDITVESIELTESYTFEDYAGDRMVNEPAGQYVFLYLRTQNIGENPKILPKWRSFKLIANNTQYEPLHGHTGATKPINKGEPYEGDEVQPGKMIDGYYIFKVPQEVKKDDISVLWNEYINDVGTKSVYWETSSR